MKKRLTQKDVAQAANVSPSAVSAALNRKGRIPESTRRHILQVAEEMGYERDPMLSALASYRADLKRVTFHGTLAFLTAKPQSPWRIPNHVDELVLRGLKERAAQLGYQVEVFDLIEQPLSRDRLERVMRARGIEGLVLTKIDNQEEIPPVNWDAFSAVEVGHGIEGHTLHRVAVDNTHATRLAMENVVAQGYRRPAMCVRESILHSEEEWLQGAYWVACDQLKLDTPIPILKPDRLEQPTRDARAWLKRWAPDVLLSNLPPRTQLPMEAAALLDALPFVCLGVKPYMTDTAGVDVKIPLLGKLAAELVTAQVERRQMGLPDAPTLTLIRGEWHPGASLPRKIERFFARCKPRRC